jgi:ubiquinone/menaquinone biosynthesis C-methylase UbiE
MSTTAAFVGSIPETYDRGMGPVIFVDYARLMAERVAALHPKRVLETAAGTGIVTQALRAALPATTMITATDLNPPMLDIAQQKLKGAANLALEPADAQDLPFPDSAFDLAVCQFGIMFYPDKPLSFREIHRVLEPGGHYLFSVWDSHANNPYALVVDGVIQGLFASDPPRFFHVPFSCASIDPLKDMLGEAGFTDITISVMPVVKTIPNIDAFAHALIYGNPLNLEIREKSSVHPDEAVVRIAKALRSKFGDDGRMKMQTIFYSARKA